ncbi:hypothetical protein SRL2020226_47980 [Mycobacterium kiyosense]|nr:hypothetical protein SRL2020226_47980 [Mycobacterium kiyosense]
MVRPESWIGDELVPVGTGAPGSSLRFVVETRRAEGGVESPFGGSKCAGRSVKRTLQPRQMHNGRAEPLLSRGHRRGGRVFGDPMLWLERALVVLVAASPRALAIAVPLTVVASPQQRRLIRG